MRTKIKRMSYLNIRDRLNLMIALDEYTMKVERENRPQDKRYLKYLKTLRKKL